MTNKQQRSRDVTDGIASPLALIKLRLLVAAICMIGAAASVAQTTPAPSPTPPQQCNVVPAPGGQTDCGDTASGVSTSSVASMNTNATAIGAGNPINLLTGNKYQKEVDLAPLPGVLGVEIVRHYNSSYTEARHAPGLVGKGWRLSYETQLFADERMVQIAQADGSRVIFSRDPKNPTQCSSADPAQGKLLIQDGASRIATTYTWVWPGAGSAGGRRLTFNAHGKLTQIAAPTGEVKTLQHEEGAAGRLLKVIDPQGRTLSLNYPGKADATTFKGVQGIQSPVGRFAYAYGAEIALAATATATATESERDVRSGQIANLSVIKSPGGVERRYHYEDAKHPTKLTGISVGIEVSAEPMQRIASWAYDADGRAVLSVKGVVPKDAQSGVEQVRITRFVPPRHDAPGRTEVVNALGQTSIFITQSVQGLSRLVQGNGAGCADCPPTNRRWAYDALGRLVLEVQLSASGEPISGERFEFDALGRIVMHFALAYPVGDRHDPTQGQSANAKRATFKSASSNTAGKKHQKGEPHERLLQRFEYDAASTEPSLVARPSVVAGQEHTIEFERNEHGQVIRVSEKGYSPLDAKGNLDPTPINRAVSYRYGVVNGHSLLVVIDGPLPNGPRNDSSDSDVTTYAYGASGTHLTDVTAPGITQSKMTYDSVGRIESVINQEGFSTTLQTDSRGQVIQVQSTGPGWQEAITERFRYDALGNRVEAIRVEGVQGNSAERIKPQWAQGFDAHGRLAWHASALGVLSQRRYDVESRLVSEGRYTNAIVQIKQYHWADNGSLAAVTDNAGRVANWLHDDRQRPAGFIDTLGRVRMTAGEEARAAVELRAEVWTDDFGQRVQRLSPDSGKTKWWFNLAGQLQAMEDALGNRSTYGYDLQGRIAEQVMRDAITKQETATRWYYEGQRLVRLEHPTQSERYAYDSRRLRVTRQVTIKTNGKEHTAVTRYEHDGQGQLTATVMPDGSRLIVERNGQGQVVALKRRKIVTPWLQWLETPQIIVKDLVRDMVGLKNSTAGNGVQSQSVRSREGDLARVVHRLPKKVMTATITNDKPWREQVSLATFSAIQAVLGIAPAHATPAGIPRAPPSSQANNPSSQQTGPLPGALNEPIDSQAIIDHRYLWDAAGNLRYVQHSAGEPKTSAYAYDMADRLIVAQTQGGDAIVPVNTANHAPKTEQMERYFHDPLGRRVLALVQTPTGPSAGVTLKTAFDTASHRWVQDGTAQASYDSAGQPILVGSKTYQWDATGKLTRTTDGMSQTSYAYDHRGLRNTKTTNKQTTHYLHDEARQLQAELDEKGQLTRQYVYLADRPVATIDAPSGRRMSAEQLGAMTQVFLDIATVITRWLGSDNGNEQITWLHLNHLAAPEAATDKNAKVVWQANYLTYGKATVKASGFTLNIRLPGQYEDQESGLHYNRQRYYDPSKGSYLTPDPSGNPDGPNSYAYVRYNPVGYVDPDGLVLFAFDGTGNTNNSGDLATLNSSESNVWQFRQLYESGNRRYVTGVGTRHRETNPRFGNDINFGWGNTSVTDMGSNFTGPERIQRMLAYFNDEMELETANSRLLDIDIVGFSRGAAQARHFANLINANTRNGQYSYTVTVDGAAQQRCQMINFRFMGLWDTVLSTNLSGTGYNMAIVPGFQHVAQAVALNEYRGNTFRRLPDSTGAFPLVSIMGGAGQSGQERIERGFIGAHADIGGGFSAGDDSTMARVAMAWMVEQARDAGVTMLNTQLVVPSSVVIHDKSDNQYCTGGPGCSEDRTVIGGVGSTQRTMTSTGMTYADTGQFVTYTPPIILADGSIRRDPGAGFVTGSVDMAGYLAWLRNNGYNLGNLQAQ